MQLTALTIMIRLSYILSRKILCFWKNQQKPEYIQIAMFTVVTTHALPGALTHHNDKGELDSRLRDGVAITLLSFRASEARR